MKAYKYLFYKFYSWATSVTGDVTPELTGLFAVSFLTYINIFTIPLLIKAFFNVKIIPLEFSKLGAFIVVFAFALVHFFILIWKGKYKKIIEEFSNETDNQKKRGTLIVIIYSGVTLALFFLSLILMGLRNRGEL